MTTKVFQLTVANGASLSGALAIQNMQPLSLCMPATWTAAAVTVQVSLDGGTTWLDLSRDDGIDYSATVSAGKAVHLSLPTTVAYNALRLRSGTSGTPVAQGGDRILSLVCTEVTQ